MECRNCESRLVDSNDIFFFTKSSKEVSLALKPERRTLIEDQIFVRVQESKKKIRIKCKKCLYNVGTSIPFGPNGMSFTAFGPEKIIFCGNKLPAKRKWSELLEKFPFIDRRNMENFFGETILQHDIDDLEMDKQTEDEPMRFASTITDFEWVSLTPRKRPRPYQVDAYIEALQQDLVIIIDTGLGKTLIASMVIARMKSLNPFRMAVMLVDRIPLVFQQGQALMEDTRLRVCRLCSENRTKRSVAKLHDGSFDVLVITAGSFLEMLNRKQLQISDFCLIVFDECHHATGDHVYSKVLRQIKSCIPVYRPRVIGLTASPFKVETVVKGRNQLNKFRANFLDASFFYPDIKGSKTEAVTVEVNRSIEQDQFIEDSLAIIRQRVDGVNKIVKGYCNSSAVDHQRLYQLKGQIKALITEYPDQKKLKAIAKDVLLLIDVIEVCELLGISHAVAVLKQFSDLDFSMKILLQKYDTDKFLKASRLKELEKLLARCTAETRAIVFVRTQLSASRLFDHLTTMFPNLNPRLVLGHGGYYGMNWEDEQKPAVKAFKEGRTNLLIATSVLEEGLDIAECDVVIRYSGPNTLINFIQSRGRARKPGSQFYVFDDALQRKSTKVLEDQEILLGHLIRIQGSRDCLPSSRSKRIKEELEREIPLEIKANPPAIVTDEVDNEYVVIQMYVRITTDELTLRDAIVNEIEQYDVFTVQRIYCNEKSAEVASGVASIFSDTDRAFLLSLKCDLPDSAIAYEYFCQHWDFELTPSTSNDPVSYVWCKNDAGKVALAETQTTWQPVRAEFGNFTNQQVFESSIVYSQATADEMGVIPEMEYSLVALNFKGNGINLLMRHMSIVYTIEIAFADLNNFALLSAEKEQLCLYIPYKFSPKITYKIWKDKERAFGDGYLERSIAENSVIALSFEPNSFQLLRKTLSVPEILPVSLFNTRVKHTYRLELEHALLTAFKSLEEDSRAYNSLWLIKAIKAKRDVCISKKILLHWCQKLKQILENGAEKLIEFEIALNQVFNSNDSYWIDLQDVFERNFENLQKLRASAMKLVRTPIPANHMMVKRIVVTPINKICLPATPVACSRLLRRFGHEFEFIIVSFREEEFQKLEGTFALHRVKSYIQHGIKAIKHYWFFCASASQLRDHKAYFVAANTFDQVQELRSRIVANRQSFKSIAKYLSRVGLFCTADKETQSIPEHRMMMKPDLKAENGEFVTDGCGKISSILAQEIHSKWKEDEPMASAYQIRFKGIKGVVLVVDKSDDEMRDSDVVYRPSMLKFENDDENFCIVSMAKYNKLFLNREVITLLTSINQVLAGKVEKKWMVENAITELNEKAVCDAAKVFEDVETARIALMEFLPKTLLKTVFESGFEVLCEQFWFSLLQHVYRLSVVSLRNKSRIPVDEGCLVMGAADPTAILKDDEIFLQVKTDEDDTATIITGDVLIYRNPCLHPGDLRWVKAVNHPKLHQWKNVVLLPAYNTSSSLAAQCSGGDLDGDLFAVIWDSRFIPPVTNLEKSLNYSELAKGAPHDYEPGKEAELFAEFFVKIMTNDTLGRVAHTHLALCDILPQGACESITKELAKSQSQAVDFPKTGIIPLVPADSLAIVRSEGYPDFMEKENGYISKKLIGSLYRRCRSLMFDFEMLTERKHGYRMDDDMDLIIDGHDAYLEDAKEKFEMYKRCMAEIMVHYSLKRESEVVLAKPLHWNPLLKADKGAVMTAIAKSYEALVAKYREEFFRDVINQEEVRKKASAWYRVSYDKRRLKQGSKQMYSFAWIVHDILCAIKRDKKDMQIKRPNMVHAHIGRSVYDEILNSRLQLESMISSKEDALRCVKAEIERFAGQDSFTVTSYGSVSMYLCDEDSDLDVCLTARENAWLKLPADSAPIRYQNETTQAKHFLEMIIMHAVDGIANSKIPKTNAKVPLITIHVGDSNSEVKVDISFNKIGELKTRFMHRLYNSNKTIFPVFWILVKWARSVGIIKSGENKATVEENDPTATATNDQQEKGDQEGLIASAEFYAVVINMLEFHRKQKEDKAEEREYKNWKRETKKKKTNLVCPLPKILNDAKSASVKDKVQVGEMLITFFRRGSSLDENIELIWPDDDIPNVHLPAQTVKLLAVHCMNALHCILATRDTTTMLSCFKDVSKQEIAYSRRIPRNLLHAMGNAVPFHSARLASITGTKISIEEGIINATGTRLAIMKLRSELHNLSVTNKALMLGILPKQTSRYFMEGATLIIMKKNSSTDAMVTFEESKGPWNMLHHIGERHHPMLKSNNMSDWHENAIERISARLFQQMHKLPMKKTTLLDSLAVSIHFGCFYTVNISNSMPPSQPTIEINDLELRIEKGRRNRKKWERGEFVGSPIPNSNDYQGTKVKLGAAKVGGMKIRGKPGSKGEKKKNSITAAFCAGVLAKNTHHVNVIESCENVCRSALKDCGFHEGRNGYIKDKIGWRVYSWPSSSYEATLKLNKEMKVDLVEERGLKWLTVNMIDGDKQELAEGLLLNNDFRINIITKDAVKEGSNLYKKVVPETDQKILRIKEGKPTVSADYPTDSKTCVYSIQHIHTCIEYCKENYDAVITKGAEYCGKDFKISRVFCDLILKYNPDHFRAFLVSGIDSNSCRRIAEELFRTGVDVSNALKANIQRIKDDF